MILDLNGVASRLAFPCASTSISLNRYSKDVIKSVRDSKSQRGGRKRARARKRRSPEFFLNLDLRSPFRLPYVLSYRAIPQESDRNRIPMPGDVALGIDIGVLTFTGSGPQGDTWFLHVEAGLVDGNRRYGALGWAWKIEGALDVRLWRVVPSVLSS